MGKLFLTSYLMGSKRFLNAFVGSIADDNKEVCFIPTASDTEGYKDYIEEAKTVFEELDFSIRIIDVAKMDKAAIINELQSCQCLYVSGGNTFYLLQELKRKDLAPYIKNKVLDGMLYIGESAGAIIASENIDYVQFMDDKTMAPDLTDYSALSLVDFCVVPHYEEFPFEQSAAKTIETYEDTLNLLSINNSEAIIVDNGRVMIMK